jgi:hypothetical protein
MDTTSETEDDGMARPSRDAGQRLIAIRASRDHGPAPTMKRQSAPNIIDQSVRDSCAMGQKPYAASIGHFVVASATAMMTRSGMTASV